MHCPEFLRRHTEYRDGVVTTPRELRRFERHLATCASCRAYDVALRRGVLALQGAHEVAPSSEFRQRLDARLRHERLQMAEPIVPVRAGIAAGLLVAVALALLGFESLHRPPTAQARALPPVPYPMPVAQAGVPFVTFQDPRSGIAAVNPTPYGTALVEPASAHR
ncbi:MAG TPA: zf-HC2 domain-containing protein [Gemmatimonadales bacterium]